MQQGVIEKIKCELKKCAENFVLLDGIEIDEKLETINVKSVKLFDDNIKERDENGR